MTKETEESYMFNDFDYIAPDLTFDEQEQDQDKMLPSELQDLRIRGYGD